MGLKVIVEAVGGYDKIKVVDDLPISAPEAGQVTVRMCAAGVNFYDLYVRLGLSPEMQPPCTLGLEGAGVVEALGEDVTQTRVGDRVIFHCAHGGAFAERINLPESDTLPCPTTMSFQEGAALTVNYLTAYFSLFALANLKEGGAVLIHGAAGGVGWAATQLAKSLAVDVTVFGTASRAKHAAILANGVDHAIDHEQDYVSEVLRLRAGGVSVVLDSVAGSDFSKGQTILEPLGMVVLLGAKGMVDGEKRNLWRIFTQCWKTKNVSPYSLIMNNAAVAGIHLNELKKKDPQTFRRGWEKLTHLYVAGKILPRIDSEWSLQDTAVAIRRIAERKNIGKVIVKP